MSVFVAQARPAVARRLRLHLEELESRLVPYSVTGDAWPAPHLVTLSFVPDGTYLGASSSGPITSNLFATFNSHPGWTTATWQDQIIKAAQYWAQQTNLNFQVVADSGADSGSGGYQQGDPQFGDIRVGAYAMTGSSLAAAYAPPSVNNFSIAGDINFNTNYSFNVGGTYDLFTVAVHEIGHALGMSHTTVPAAAMYPAYTGTKSSLNSDDVAGIRSIYSNGNPRSGDTYSGGSGNHSFANAVNLTAELNPTTLSTLQSGMDITSAGENDYYKVTAPQTTSGTLVVKVQTAGLSLLRQAVTVYASNQSTVLGSASSAGAYDGTTDTVTLHGVSAGQVFYVEVAGADATAFGTGAYALALNFTSGTSAQAMCLSSGASALAPLPTTQTLNGTPLQAGGGESLVPPIVVAAQQANQGGEGGQGNAHWHSGPLVLSPEVGWDALHAPVPPGQPFVPGDPRLPCTCPACLRALGAAAQGATSPHGGTQGRLTALAPAGPAEGALASLGSDLSLVVAALQGGGDQGAGQLPAHDRGWGLAGQALDALFADADLLAGLDGPGGQRGRSSDPGEALW